MSEQGLPVELYVYDLTLGFASLLAPAIIGRAVEGVWHTALVAYGREFFYGAHGITSCAPGSTQLGAPQRVERLGETFVPYPVFADYLRALAASSYTPAAYHLLQHNCNHFTDEAAGFLCGGSVPKHILRQPDDLLSGPQRAALQALLDSLAPPARTVYASPAAPAPAARRHDSPDYDALNDQIEAARRGHGSAGSGRSSEAAGSLAPCGVAACPAGVAPDPLAACGAAGCAPAGAVAGAPGPRAVAAARALSAALHALHALRRRAPPLPDSYTNRKPF